jgi:hypothetical protein
MANSYNINQINLLITQQKLKKHLKPKDSIFVDKENINNLEETLQNHKIKYDVIPTVSAYQVVIKSIDK